MLLGEMKNGQRPVGYCPRQAIRDSSSLESLALDSPVRTVDPGCKTEKSEMLF